MTPNAMSPTTCPQPVFRSLRPVRCATVALIVAFVGRGADPVNAQAVPTTAAAANSAPTALQNALRLRLEHNTDVRVVAIDGEMVHAMARLLPFYATRAFEPLWVDSTGMRPALKELLDALRGAAGDGLRPVDYHVPALEATIRALTDSGRTNQRLVDTELLASDGFLQLASHLLAGYVDPKSAKADWFVPRSRADLLALLGQVATTAAVRGALSEVSPRDPAYHTLKLALATYLDIAARGDWPRVPAGPTLRMGDTSRRVVTLRARLRQSGDLTLADSSPRFDAPLQVAVARFQSRHGLDIDSAVGVGTLRAMNVSAARRADQIRLNLERWRWLPPVMGDRYIVVNIPAFEMKVVDSGRTVLRMRSIVGRAYRNTPIFTDTLTYLVMSPYWNVPPNLAVMDILPKVRKNIGYLATQRITVFRGNSNTPVDPRTVNWASVGGTQMPYRFRQDPGPLNSMGRVKFMFPNQFNVYMHDTPDHSLFDKAERSFSSGCVRLSEPLALAEYLLRANGGWDIAAIDAATSQSSERSVQLKSPIPVHLLYWTAWADVDGTTHFREDIYERDAPLSRALTTGPRR